MKFFKFTIHILNKFLNYIVAPLLGMTIIMWFASLAVFGWAFALDSYLNNSTTLNLILYLIYISPIFVGIGFWLKNEWKKFEKNA